MSQDQQGTNLPPRPKTRGDCADGVRPCPYVSCAHHLYLDVSRKTGAFQVNHRDLESWELDETCALDVADRGGATLEEVGALMNVTRERIRQIEATALRRLLPLASKTLSGELPAPRRAPPPMPAPVRRLPIVSPPRPAPRPDPVDGPRAEPAVPPVVPAKVDPVRETPPAAVVEAAPVPAPAPTVGPPPRPVPRRRVVVAVDIRPPAAPEPPRHGPTTAELEAARIATLRPLKPPPRRRAADDEWPLWERA
jgi:hypothetical protein